MTYGKVHRFFLRTVASQGVLSIPDAQSILDKFNDGSDLSVTDIVKAINDEIRPYYQEIKLTKDEVTNEGCIVFISVADDAATKAQNIFSAPELEYFRVLIEQIMSTKSRQITNINAMNLVSTMKSNLTKTDAQKVLDTWCRMHYFVKELDNYALGLRAIHEFEGYFRQNMEHAVEECCLCKHIVFRGYNCPGCGEAIHTRCLKGYLERVQNWPCCKLDFEQEQLESLINEGSRLPPTQILDATRNTEENNTVPELTQTQESAELMDETQEVIPEISQRINRKRKRQTSPQIQVSTTRRASTDSTVIVPTQDATSRSSSRDSTVEASTGVTISRSAKNSSTRSDSVEAPSQVTVTHRSTRGGTIEAPTQASTRSSRNTGPVAARTQHRSTRTDSVEAPLQVTTTRRSTRGGTLEAPTQATRSSSKNNILEEPVTEIQESFQNMEVKAEVPQATQRVTRKRKQKQ